MDQIPTEINPIIFPLLSLTQNPFQERILAFSQMADSHPMSAYMRLCAQIARAQSRTVAHALNDVSGVMAEISFPLLKDHPNGCLGVLKILLNELLKDKSLNAAARDVVSVLVRYVLNQQEHEFLSQEAECLMALDLEKITIEFSPFIGAALQVFYTIKAFKAGLVLNEGLGLTFEKNICPCCGMPPLASVIINQGRYLMCGVCDTKWHLDQNTCHECHHVNTMSRVSLQNSAFKIKAEYCSDCMTYLKWLDLTKNMAANVFVEEMVSRDLDAALLAQNYFSLGQNFYMLTKTE